MDDIRVEVTGKLAKDSTPATKASVHATNANPDRSIDAHFMYDRCRRNSASSCSTRISKPSPTASQVSRAPFGAREVAAIGCTSTYRAPLERVNSHRAVVITKQSATYTDPNEREDPARMHARCRVHLARRHQ